jgi:Tfp pilus assembly protein FimT
MRRSAFTILEVTLVLAVLLIIAAITVPSIDNMYSDLRLTAAADTVRGQWAEARARAMEDGIAYRFAVINESGKFRVAPNAGEFWGDDEEIEEPTDSQPLIVEDELPQGIQFGANTGTGSGDWATVAVFQPDGTARSDVEVIFTAGGGRPLTLRLRGLTGSVTITRGGDQ